MKEFYFSKLVKSILYLGIFLTYPSHSWGQYNGAFPQRSILNPDAAALFKVSERPIGSFTGTTPISFPLHTLTSGTIQCPISISYFNGGIGVQEIASSVGLGWNLYAGGMITRIMRGIPDDDSYGGMLHASAKPSSFNVGNILDNIHNVLSNVRDVEPDIFFFNCNGLSGKFFFDESGNVKMMDQQPIKIVPVWTGSTITSWIITTNDGSKYSFGFGKVDKTVMNYSSANRLNIPNYNTEFISSWQLVKITDMNEQNEIHFSYELNYGHFENVTNSSMIISNMVGSDCSSSDSMGDEITISSKTDQCYLTKILGKNDSLVFYTSPRRDYRLGKKIDSIGLFTRNGQLIKKHHFLYSYFSAVDDPYDPDYDYIYKRLKLSKISEFGTNPSDSLTHKFDYIESSGLPSRVSKGIDYWGFYNGQSSNTTMMPNGNYVAGTNIYKREDLGDRRANPLFSSINTLNRITFPTGGSREFIYEGNKALVGIESQIQPDASYFSEQSFIEDNFIEGNHITPSAKHNFTVNTTEGSSKVNFTLYHNGNYLESEVRIIKVLSSTNEYQVSGFFDEDNGSSVLDNGNYRVEVYVNGEFTNIYAIEGAWKEMTLPTSTIDRYGATHLTANMNVGGIRVKEIKDYDPTSNKTYKTSYKYYLTSDTSLTSGLLISPVRVATVGSCGAPTRDCFYIQLFSESNYPLSREGGAFVYYPEVRTFEEGNGYIDREFSFAYDEAPRLGSIFDFPILPPNDASWKRGHLRNQKKYNNNNQLLVHNYSEGIGWGANVGDNMYSSQIGYKVAGFYDSSSCNHSTMGPPCQGCINAYEMGSYFSPVVKSFEKVYNGGSNPQEVLIECDYYTNLGRPLIKEQRIYLNNGTIKKTNYRYAFNSSSDFSFGLSGPEQSIATNLIDLNFLQPLEISTTLVSNGNSPVLTEGIKYSFGIFNSSKIHLTNVRNYSSATDFKETIFTLYDSHGNLLEKYSPGEAREVYLWGYNQSYPVARILGSSYSDISTWVNTSVLNNPTDDAALRSHLSTIRTNLSGTISQVKSYTYKPSVGITSFTDAKGKDTFYEYDDFMRLKNEKDKDGKIVKSYQYHYKP